LSPDTEHSTSEANGIVLLIAITIILAAIVLLLLIQFPAMWDHAEVPTEFEISSLRHTNLYGALNYESYMVLTNIGDTSWDNRKLYAKTYRNGVLLPCLIRTINGHDFIPLKPYGIDTMGGWGTHNYHWYPGMTIYVDYSQGTFHPGDVVKFEVYDRDTDRIISEDTWPHTGGNTKKWMDILF
jgi:hypothetical protein